MISAPDTVERAFHDVITSAAALRELIGQPTELVVRKQLSALDVHALAFIARSPLLLLGTSNPAGMCDVSPKGDAPGFVRALDDKTLAIPDRVGNRRIDSLMNIVENPHVGLIFLIPGMDETLRVNGGARIVRDDDLLEAMAVQGRRPNVAIVVDVQECFLHCPKAFIRSHFWDPSRYMNRSEMPSLYRMLLDQTKPADRCEEDHERLVQEEEQRRAATPLVLY